MTTRRQFLQTGLAAAALAASRRGLADKATRPLRLLILGGTGFLGPHLVEIAQSRGHTVSIFNRGKTRPELFPDVEKLRGDRRGDLKSLEGKKWDAVIDDTGYVPKFVRMSAELLAPNVGYYLFVSSVSVYPDDVKPDADESAAVQTTPDPLAEKVTEKNYGALKALCEQEVAKALPGRSATVRPGLIVGPGDLSDRYTYWVLRMEKGGEVLAPSGPDNPAQVIDVRDLTGFMIRCAEQRTAGVFNGTGQKTTLGALLASCRKASNSTARITYADAAFLKQHQIGHWDDMKDWQSEEGTGLWQVDNSRALKAGLTCRSGDETAADTLKWWRSLPEARRAKPLRAHIPPEKEAEVLAAWKARAG